MTKPSRTELTVSVRGDGLVTSGVDNIGGTVAPGTSPGILDVDGTFTQLAGGTLAKDDITERIGGVPVMSGVDVVDEILRLMGLTLSAGTRSTIPSPSQNGHHQRYLASCSRQPRYWLW